MFIIYAVLIVGSFFTFAVMFVYVFYRLHCIHHTHN